MKNLTRKNFVWGLVNKDGSLFDDGSGFYIKSTKKEAEKFIDKTLGEWVRKIYISILPFKETP